MTEEFDGLDLFVDDAFFFDFDFDSSESPPAEDFIRSSPDSSTSWIGQIESQLMNDENHEQMNFLETDQQSVSEFLADIFVDCPITDSGSIDFATAEVPDVPVVDLTSEKIATEKEPDVFNDSPNEKEEFLIEKKSDESNDSGSENSDRTKAEDEIEGNDDPVDKKRRRRLRNRDAAVRSRERKKEYVKDLETKSKYLERECMRLGRMLQCCVAENQSLRLFLEKGGKTYDASMTKQESAVLLLESLLLGSLLWYLVNIICSFPQPHTGCWLPPPMETEEPENLVPRGQGSSIPFTFTSFLGKSRGCKGSRPRMKWQILPFMASDQAVA